MAYTTINKSSLHMNTKTFTGNGGTQSITGVGFKPDWTWLKKRNGTANHHLVDVVRGAGYYLYGNLSNAQGGNGSVLLTSFNTDGFTLDAGADSNASGATGVSWNWKAAGSQGSSNTAGSINTTYTSANTTAGFSISQYTGTGSNATVGHGLGAVPKMIIVKRTNASDVWRVYHGSIGATKHLVLNTTAGEASGSNVWNDTAPTSSVFSISTDSAVNASGATYIAYCFADVQGYSKIGSYTGNGNADGTFVFTGMKPAFIMIKATSGSENWQMYDNKRDGYNVDNNMLRANLSNAEQTDNDIDILSNGFKLRRNSGAFNSSGSTYIYMAFGQSIVGTNNLPCTAR